MLLILRIGISELLKCKIWDLMTLVDELKGKYSNNDVLAAELSQRANPKLISGGLCRDTSSILFSISSCRSTQIICQAQYYFYPRTPAPLLSLLTPCDTKENCWGL